MSTSSIDTFVAHPFASSSARVSWAVYHGPLGPLTLIGGAAGLKALYFPGRAPDLPLEDHRPAAFATVIEQLAQYFDGERRQFEIALDLAGSAFQCAVWERLRTIPYGSTVSYSALARSIGRLDRVRAVAAAIGQTPVPIIVPCHRVVAADGGLTGYAGGLQRKAALLSLERRTTAGLPHEQVRAVEQLALL